MTGWFNSYLDRLTAIGILLRARSDYYRSLCVLLTVVLCATHNIVDHLRLHTRTRTTHAAQRTGADIQQRIDWTLSIRLTSARNATYLHATSVTLTRSGRRRDIWFMLAIVAHARYRVAINVDIYS